MKKSKNEEAQQTVLTIKELSLYSGYKVGYLYQLVHKRLIPSYKPNKGRKLFFEKMEIDNWLLERKLYTLDEINGN